MAEDNKDLNDMADDAMDKAKKGADNLADKAEDAFDSTKDKAKDLGDKASGQFDDAKEKASEFAHDAKEKASEFAHEAKEKASDFADEAKKTANEFTENAKEAFDKVGGENKKLLAGILAIIFGSLGVHKFILGYQKEGIILLVATIIGYATMCFFIGSFIVMATCVIGLIEGIIYLTKSDEEFYNTYQVGRKPWF
ncbi:MAG: NINE protein [Flavobacteriaceae bacterium]